MHLEVDADKGSSVSIFILAIRTLPLSLKSAAVQNLHRLHCFLISGKSYIIIVFL